MDSTRIIRVYIPGNKVVQQQMFRRDWLYSIPDYLLSNYPEAFVGWINLEFGFYHRTAGWLSIMELKVGDRSLGRVGAQGGAPGLSPGTRHKSAVLPFCLCYYSHQCLAGKGGHQVMAWLIASCLPCLPSWHLCCLLPCFACDRAFHLPRRPWVRGGRAARDDCSAAAARASGQDV